MKNHIGLNREQKFLKDQAEKGKFSKQTQADFAEGRIRFIDSDVRHTAEITEGGGIFDLLKTTNNKVVGLSDFDGDKLEPGVNVSIGRMRLAFGSGEAVDNPTALSVPYSTDISKFPVELLRGKVAVIQDGKTKLRLPVERFTTAATSSKVQGEEDVLSLGSLILLEESKPIKLQIEFNEGIDAGTKKYFVQMAFMGTETATR